MRRTRENNVIGKKYFQAELTALGCEMIPTYANFVLVRVGDGQRVFEQLQKHGVIVRPMGGYKLPEWIRISIGTPEENARCVNSLKKILS